jgi:hypothetical protein
LRLLLAGHFKAVPEQRLRENFADLLPQPADESNPGIPPNDEDPIDVNSTEVNPTDAKSTDVGLVDADLADGGPRLEGPDVIASVEHERTIWSELSNVVDLFA